MTKTIRNSLPLFAALAVLAMTSTSEAAWPRYRVNAAYSLPSAPTMRPMFVPVYPTDAYLQANPGVVPATYGAPQISVPGYGAPVAPANMPPSLAPPAVSVPNTSYYPQANYPQTYGAAPYAQPAYTPYSYNQAPPTTSYYNPSPYQQYQQPRPIQPYTGNVYAQQPAVQPYGGFYQPTRPSTFYSPTPSYYPQQPVFGQY